MGAESRSHLEQNAQRTFRRIFLICSAVLILVLTPLILSGDLRLDLARRFNLIPGENAVQIADADDGVTLIVVPIQATNASRRPETRFRAVFLASSGPNGVELTFIDNDERITVPLEEYDFYSASFDGNHVLFQDTRDPDQVTGVLIDMTTHDVVEMPSDQPFPADIPGDWETGAWETSMGKCGGYSPNAKYFACFKDPKLATYLAGDWQLRVYKYGQAKESIDVYRGVGFLPWVGWSADDSRLYFQNEVGLWMVPLGDGAFGDP